MLAMSTLVIPVDQKDASTNLTFEPRTPPHPIGERHERTIETA